MQQGLHVSGAEVRRTDFEVVSRRVAKDRSQNGNFRQRGLSEIKNALLKFSHSALSFFARQDANAGSRAPPEGGEDAAMKGVAGGKTYFVPPLIRKPRMSGDPAEKLFLRREVAGDVQDQLRQSGGVGVDGAVIGGHDCHVGGDEAVVGIQRRYRGLALAVRPQGQVRHGAARHHRRIKDEALGCAGRSALTGQYIDAVGRIPDAHEGLAVADVTGVEHAAGRQRIQ